MSGTFGSWIPLYLGDFLFDEQSLEVPQNFGSVAGTQAIQQHDFPGGIRTHQSFGYFPATLTWRAHFHSPDAADRVEEIKRILVAGRETTLQYGERSWLGRLHRFTSTARHNWLYDYELEFWPRVDTSSGLPQAPPLTAGMGTIIDLHILALKSMLADGSNGLNLLVEGIASQVGGPMGSFINLTQATMLAAGGVINSITTQQKQAVAASALQALAATAPLQASSDPTLSSPASDMAARVQTINAIMSLDQPQITTVPVVNPNLVLLATQYYQDPQHWTLIANANGLADPMPLGSYNLIIPMMP